MFFMLCSFVVLLILAQVAARPQPLLSHHVDKFPASLKASSGIYGVDVSQATSATAFGCLKNSNNVDYAVVRCYTSRGVVDAACPGSVAAAHAAGIDTVDVYFFPSTFTVNYDIRINVQFFELVDESSLLIGRQVVGHASWGI